MEWDIRQSCKRSGASGLQWCIPVKKKAEIRNQEQK